MRKTIATALSVLLHPMLMPTYGILLFFFGMKGSVYDYMTPEPLKWRLAVIVLVFTFIFPSINIFVLYKLQRIGDITLSDQKERTFPYLVTSLFYFGLFYLLMDVNLWPEIKLFILGAGLAILLTALINTITKISAHMVGIGGLTGVTIALSYLARLDLMGAIVIMIVVAGVIGAARLVLSAHTAQQVYLGFGLGLLVQVTMLFIGLGGGFLA